MPEQHGADANQRASTNALAMDYRPVPNRNIVFDCIRIAGVAMDDAAVLHVDPLTDYDRRDIASNYGAEPHATFGAKVHITGDGRATGEKRAGRGFTKPVHATKGNFWQD